MHNNELFLDRQSEIRMTQINHFPHWNQCNKLQFVTFRLADSLPQSIIKDITERKKLFEKNNPRPWDKETELHFSMIASKYEEKLLDNGYGECLLRRKDVRDIIIETLLKDNGSKYSIWSIVIMPNHLHMILQIFEDYDLQQIISSFKSISSHRINRLLVRKGDIWNKNYHDRLIRDETHLANCLNYIASNPTFLPTSDYTYLRLQ